MALDPILCVQWLAAKEHERQATELRRHVEDEITKALALEPNEGTTNIDAAGFQVKVTGRFNRKIDTKTLEEIAAENGAENHLGTLFRWKPEIDARAWRAADESVTNLFSKAITTTPGRPSFSITPTDEGK